MHLVASSVNVRVFQINKSPQATAAVFGRDVELLYKTSNTAVSFKDCGACTEKGVMCKCSVLQKLDNLVVIVIEGELRHAEASEGVC